MKTCIQCGEEFKPRGRQKVCGGCKDGMQERVQEAEETRPQRPIDRFRNNRIVFGGAAVIRR